MLTSTENSHLRKYLTTLGVAIVAGSFTLAGFFFKVQADLLVENAKIVGLSPLAQRTLARRQQYLDVATAFLPWLLLGFVVLGLAMMCYGLVGWARRQGVLDQKEDVERDRSVLELARLTREESNEKRQLEAAEVLASEDSGASGSRGSLVILPASEGELTTAVTGEASTKSSIVSEIQAIETSIFSSLQSVFGQDRASAQVRVAKDGRQRTVDALVRPAPPLKGLAVEVKYSLTGKNLRSRLQEAVINVSETIEILGGNSVYSGLVVLAFKDGLESIQEDRVRTQFELTMSGIDRCILVVVAGRETVMSLSSATVTELLRAAPLGVGPE